MVVEIGHVGSVDLSAGGYVPVSGEHTTTFQVPDDMGPSAALAAITEALPYHLANPDKAEWVRCPDSALRSLLVQQLSIDPQKNRRPAQWGQAPRPEGTS